MKVQRKSLLIAAAATALIGGAALAASAHTHHVQVALPDGEIVRVSYIGDVAPRVVVQPAASAPVVVARPIVLASGPFMAMGFPVFGPIDRIFADMQRQQAVMMQRVAAMQHDVAAHGTTLQSTAQHPANSANWSYVSSTTTSNGCTQTVQWNSQAGAAPSASGQPQVIRTSSGNCDKAVKETPVHPVADVQSQAKNLPGKVI